MGEFDDLIPRSGTPVAEANPFSDLIPKPATPAQGLFDDLIPTTHVDEYGNRITRGKEIPDPRAGRSFFENLKDDLPSPGEFVGDVMRPIVKPLTDIGVGLRNVATDAIVNAAQSYGIIKPDTAEMNRVNGNPFSNIESGLTGQKPPAEKAIELANEEDQSRGKVPVAGIAASFGQNVIRDLPKFYALGAVGKTLEGASGAAKIAGGAAAGAGLFGYDDEGNMVPKQAALMAVLPGVSRLGEAAAVSALSKVGVQIGSEAGLEVVKRIGSSVAQQALFNAADAPEYLNATPQQRWEIFARNISNLGFEAPGLAHVFASVKEEAAFNKAFAENIRQHARESALTATLPNSGGRLAPLTYNRDQRNVLSPVEQVPEGTPGSPITSRLSPTVPRETVVQPTPEEQPTTEVKAPEAASVPVMITRQMEADLKSRGMSQQQIDALTPQAANNILSKPVVPPDDFTHYTQVESRLRELIAAKDFKSPELQPLLKEKQDIRNRNGDDAPLDPTDPDYATKKAAMDARVAAKQGKNVTKESQPVVAVKPVAASELEVLETLEGTGDLSAKQKKRLKELRAAAPVEVMPPDETGAPIEIPIRTPKGDFMASVRGENDPATGQIRIKSFRVRDPKTGAYDNIYPPEKSKGFNSWSDAQAAGLRFLREKFPAAGELKEVVPDAKKEEVQKVQDVLTPSKEATGKDTGAVVAQPAGEEPAKAAAAPVVQEESPKVKLMKMGLTAKQAGDVATGRRKLEEFIQPPAVRTLDTKADLAYGPSFTLGLGPIDAAKPVSWIRDNTLNGWRASGEGNADKYLSKRVIIFRDNATGELIESSIREDANTGPKLVGAVTKGGKATWTEAKPFLTEKQEDGTPRYTPVASARYSEPNRGVRRVITQDELKALDEQHQSNTAGMAETSAENVGAKVAGTAELEQQPGVRVVTKDELKAKPKVEPLEISKADAGALLDAVGKPQWTDKQDAREVVLSALETSSSKQVQAFLKTFWEHVRSNDLDTEAELYKLIDRIHESVDRNVEAVTSGALPPESYRASVTSDIIGKRAGAVQPGAEVQAAGEGIREQAGTDVRPEGEQLTWKEAGYKSEKSFRKDFDKNRIAEVEETESEFMRRRFCAGEVPKTRVRATE